MQLFTTKSRLDWGSLDVPLMGAGSDWSGKHLIPPLGFSLAIDPGHLWFVATRQAPASQHPDAPAGKFFPGLWNHDVSELFLGDPASGSYLELNLAANGAWWAAKFDSPRVASANQPDFQAHVRTFSDDGEPGAWVCAMSIAVDLLKKEIGFGLGTTGNVTFIMNSPAQTFHSAAKLPGVEPDFHQPAFFPKLIPCELPAL